MELEPIIAAIRAERCLPFLGAGASASYSAAGCEVPGISLGSKLGEKIAAACGYRNGSTYDLPRVAEYFVYARNGRREDLEDLISEEIRQVAQPRPIQTALAQLFLGYSLEDWNFRVVWEGVLANYRDSGAQLESYALLKLPADAQKANFLRTFWARRNIALIDCDLTDFAVALATAFKLDLPQLGFVKGEPAPGGATP